MRGSGRGSLSFFLAVVLLPVGAVESFGAAALNPSIGESQAHPASVSPTKKSIKVSAAPVVQGMVPDVSGGSPVRVLVIGTGVAIPSGVVPAGVTVPTGGSDPFGYGTLAASVLAQSLSNVEILSYPVVPEDPSWTQAKQSSVDAALDYAYANRANLDAVLLALPPSSVLDPLSYMEALVSYGPKFGTGLSNLHEGLMSNLAETNGAVGGIPWLKADRDVMFARANLRQRDAIERFVARYQGWREIRLGLKALDTAGVPVIAPAGDFTLRDSGDNMLSAYPQSVYGLSALDEVITVGAAADFDPGVGVSIQLSPVSAIGPTLDLRSKPDLLVRGDVTGFVPSSSVISSWDHDGPFPSIDWRTAPDTFCSALPSSLKCVLQASTIVSAAVAAATAGSLVRQGIPNLKASRNTGDDEIIRNLLQAASTTGTDVYGGARDAYPWEEGGGLFDASVDLINDHGDIPVPYGEPIGFGEAGFGAAASGSVSLWPGGDTTPDVAGSSLVMDSFIGSHATGDAQAYAYTDTGAAIASISGGTISLTRAADDYQPGVYAGRLKLKSDSGDVFTYPVDLLQLADVSMQVEHPYGGALAAEGERVEDVTFALMPAVPLTVGIFNRAFKYMTLLDSNVTETMVRYAVTKGGFVSASSASEGGTATLEAPPGYWRYFVLSNYDMLARQQRKTSGQVGAEDDLGIRYAGSGTEAANIPGGKLLVSSLPPCEEASSTKGPVPIFGGGTCLDEANISGTKDPATGWCDVQGTVVTGGTNRQFSYQLYCDPAQYALPVGVTSRAVYHLNFATGEWQRCSLNIPPSQISTDLDELAGMITAPTCVGTDANVQPKKNHLWNFKAGAPHCLGPTEALLYPDGRPEDFTAEFKSQSWNQTPAEVPVGLATFDFDLPQDALYSDISVSFGYKLENAMVALRARGGDDAVGDTSGSFIVAAPNVAAPLDAQVKQTGTHYSRYRLQTTGADGGSLSLIIIPTSWSTSSQTKHRPLAQICDAVIRVKTFSKQRWQQGSGMQAGKFVIDQETNDLEDDVDHNISRIRSRYVPRTGQDEGSFQEICWACGYDGLDDTWTHDTSWIKKTPTTTPGARYGHGLVYDTTDDEGVLFAGHTGDGRALADTWKWNGTTWIKQAPTQSPPARWGHAIAYDPDKDRTIIHGGTNGTSILDDTWAYDGTTWTQLAVGTKPKPRAHHAMAYDTTQGQLVMFGGIGIDTIGTVTTSNLRFNDTWTLTWNTATSSYNWAKQTPSYTMPKLSNHAMASLAGTTYLFGGYDADFDEPSAEMFKWGGPVAGWAPVSFTGAGPAGRVNYSMVFRGSDLILHGGASVKDLTTDTSVQLAGMSLLESTRTDEVAFYDDEVWKFDTSASTWSEITPTTRPSARAEHQMIYDDARDELVIYGGAAGRAAGSIYEFDGAAWQQRSPGIAPSPRRDHGVAYDPITSTTIIFGGLAGDGTKLADTWSWDGHAWTQLTPATAPSARSGHTLTYDPISSKIIMFGGTDTTDTRLNETWTFNGTSWTKLNPITKPPARSDHSAAYDTLRSRLVIFGGNGTQANTGIPQALSDTWEWNGVTWTSGPLTGPSARAGHGMAYHAAAAKVVLFGGGSSNGLAADTWTYDGVTWLPVSGLGPSARINHTINYDANRNKIVLYGGSTTTTSNSDTWEFTANPTGGTWNQVTTSITGRPPAAVGEAIYDPATNRILLFATLCLGHEQESVTFGLHTPKNTARVDETDIPNRVRLDGNATTSDGPGYLEDIRSASTSLTQTGKPLEGFTAVDPKIEAEQLTCDINHPLTGELCRQIIGSTVLQRLPTFMAINHRFFGYIQTGYQATKQAEGKLTFVTEDQTDGGAFMNRWSRGPQGNLQTSLTVSDFYGDQTTDGLNTQSSPALTGWITYDYNHAAPNQMQLTLGINPPGEDDYQITVNYDCQDTGNTTCV
jgi:hypothetical protein